MIVLDNEVMISEMNIVIMLDGEVVISKIIVVISKIIVVIMLDSLSN